MIRTQPIDVMHEWRQLWAQLVAGFKLSEDQAARFAQANTRARLNHFLVSGFMALAIFNLFLISDRYMVPDVFEFALSVRLFVLTPFVLTLLLAGCAWREWWLRNLPPWAIDLLGMVGTSCVAASLGAVMMLSHSDQVPIYQAGLVPVMVFGNLVLRLRFRFAVCTSLFIVGVFGVAFCFHSERPPTFQVLEVPNGLLLMLVALYSLASNFNLEMDERQGFLQKERAQALRDELEHLNVSLQAMSRCDPLTGLANRRQFNDYVAASLNEAGAGRRMVVILIDVDHFKAFNDRYGHPAGDQCLRLVAGALNEAAHGQACQVARWGGEEFAVVLPDGDAVSGLKLAEAMRAAVVSLAMRHESSTCGEQVTISLGVSAAWVYASAKAVDSLLRKADEALYKAKAEGRDRCVLASGPLD